VREEIKKAEENLKNENGRRKHLTKKRFKITIAFT